MYNDVFIEISERFQARQISRQVYLRALKILERDREEIEDSPESKPEDIADNIILLATL